MDRSSSTCPSHRRRGGFTLVELLVVIGIIAVLISILLPTVNSARRQADRLKCLSNMRQMGQAYILYANDNKGGFPVVRWTYAGFDKRWHDFIGRYLVGTVGVKIGTQMVTGDLNPSGSQLASKERQMWSPEIMNGNNALWGCPTWRRATVTNGTLDIDSIYHNGYAQNPYYTSPNDIVGASINTKMRTLYTTDASGRVTAGNWPKFNQYSKPGDRCLVVESVHAIVQIPSYVAWPYAPEGATPFPSQPDGGSNKFSVDFDRHGKRPKGNGPNDLSLNMLYCDGHAAYVNAREAYRAIRFR